jgi:beta-aspartyl-peptidase (threonine type)
MPRFAFAIAGLLGIAGTLWADDAADIKKVLDDQVAAWNKGDLEGFMKGYWKSPDLTFVSGKDITRGWQETLERYNKRYQADGKEMGKLAFNDVVVKELAPGVALVTGKWEVTLSKETVGGRYSLILKKLADGWRIVHDHTSG